MTRARRRAATTLGPGVVFHGEPRIDNRGELHIDADAVISSRPALTHLATGDEGVMRVGRRARIGHGVALSALALVVIGDDAVLGPFAMVMDSDFHVAGSDDEAPEPRPVHIGAGARIGHRAVLLPGATIGAGAVVDPGSVVAGAVGDGVHVGGNPAVPAGGPGSGRTVAELVADVFGLSSTPGSDVRPADVPGWDSLGALRLLVSLEAELGVVLDDGLVAASSVGELERLALDAAP